MKHTSLQNIIAKDPARLEQSEICKLFQRHRYPCFELNDLKEKPELMKKQTYIVFLRILEQWNKNVGNPAKEINECDYRKNEFIFSWLKWVGVQSSKYIDSSLARLQHWYNSCRVKQPKIGMRRQNLLKSYIQEWQIRNSYKSNLPLEIENYKRRAIMHFKTAASSPRRFNEKENYRTAGDATPQLLNSAKTNKKQNSYLRDLKEKQEMDEYLSNFRKTRVQFYKNLAKNYYKREFSRDKLETQYPKIQEKLSKSAQIKDIRIKTTTQGFRQLQSNKNLAMNQTEMLSFYQNKNEPALKPELHQNDLNTTASESKSLNTSNIDGLGLLVNPFEIKIKKKKRS